MNWINPSIIIGGVLLGSGLQAQVAPAVGTISEDVRFTVNQSTSSFDDTRASEFSGKILVLMYYTPWCPICRTNVNDVFSDVLSQLPTVPGQGLLRVNEQGVEIESILLSNIASGFDNSIRGLASGKYQRWGIDALADGSLEREGMGFFRGADFEDPGFITDRRRLVILNVVPDSEGREFLEILVNQEAVGLGDFSASEILAMMNGVQPEGTAAPQGLDFETWRSGFTFPPNQDGPGDDPDRDGMSNVWEFFSGGNPTGPDVQPVILDFFAPLEGGPSRLVYRRAKDLTGFVLKHRVSTNLGTWDPVEDSEIVFSLRDRGTHDEVEASLPAVSGGRAFYQLELELEGALGVAVRE